MGRGAPAPAAVCGNGPQWRAGRGKPASLSEVSDSGRNLQPEIRSNFRCCIVCWDSQGYSRNDVGYIPMVCSVVPLLGCRKGSHSVLLPCLSLFQDYAGAFLGCRAQPSCHRQQAPLLPSPLWSTALSLGPNAKFRVIKLVIAVEAEAVTNSFGTPPATPGKCNCCSLHPSAYAAILGPCQVV